MRSHEYHVYIVTNHRGTLYTGVTNGIERRLRDHETGSSRFTARYRIWKLLFVQSFADVNEAIAAEKRINGWTRAKKLALIRQHNPMMRDLAWRWRRPRAGPGAYIGEGLRMPVTLTKEACPERGASRSRWESVLKRRRPNART